MSSNNTLSPVQRTAAMAGAFLALGAIVVAASQGGAAALSAAELQERNAKIESAHSVTQGVTSVESVKSKAAAFEKALGAGSLKALVEPGNVPATIAAAKQACDLAPTWAAAKSGVADSVAKIMGASISDAQLASFAASSIAIYCPAQAANIAG
ncbi:MAG: hypothetical protein ACT4QF_09515 [Sporichthyaceae bacterium]